jgi:hypothetical protein
MGVIGLLPLTRRTLQRNGAMGQSPIFVELTFHQHRLSIPNRLTMELQDARALLVGAGGIGCELLKTLSLHNLKEIFIVRFPPFAKLTTGRLGHHRPLQPQPPIPLSHESYQKVQGAGIPFDNVTENRSRKK